MSKAQNNGGSSSYYDLDITRLSDAQNFEVQAGDIIRSVFQNDFDMGNIFKALVRISKNTQGEGKKGVGIEYDCNKIIYFTEILKERFKGE